MRLRYLFLFVSCVFSLFMGAQSSSDIASYITQFKQIALDQEREFGIPAPITLAQGIVESGAGKSVLTRKSNNHFGMKAGKGWNGPIHKAMDDESEESRFRCYSSAEESYADHARLLRNDHYRKYLNYSIYDYRSWAHGLKRAGYATSPTYAKALIGIIDTYKLYAINGGVKLRPGKTITIIRTITREELVERKDIQMDESEESEEQESYENTYRRYVGPEINGVRCTMIYPGESLSSIALKYDISKKDLLSYNDTTNEDDFQEGDIVFLDKKKKQFEEFQDFYRAKEGDSLYSISQLFGIRLANLIKMNNKSIFSTISEGEVIKLKKGLD